MDFRRRDIRDAITVITLASIIFVGGSIFAFFTLGPFAEATHGVELPVITGTLLVCCLLALFFSTRRLQDLQREITARQQVEARAARCSKVDHLTGLPNPTCLSEQTTAALQRAGENRGRIALLVLDVDDFRPAAHLHGDTIANALLLELADRIKPVLPPKGVLARVGDDDFAVMMSDIDGLDAPTRLARRLTVLATEPFHVKGHQIQLGASIGIAISPDDGERAEDLMRRAKVALARAKAEGPCSVRFFVPEMDAAISKQAQLVDELRAAIASSAITPFYQPIVDLKTSRIIAFEALARWTSPSLGPVSPELFIKAAEDAGLIEDLAMQLLRRACRDAMTWSPEIKLSFNMSPVQLKSRALGLRVLSLLGETGLAPSRLEIEITESKLVENTDLAHSVLSELANAGVKIALDDYGTANATLPQLLSLPFDRIKIDRSLVARIGSKSGETVLRAIISIAHGLDMHITAEGIETKDQVDQLIALGCAEGQGYLLGHPVPAAQTAAVIRRAAAKEARPKRASMAGAA